MQAKHNKAKFKICKNTYLTCVEIRVVLISLSFEFARLNFALLARLTQFKIRARNSSPPGGIMRPAFYKSRQKQHRMMSEAQASSSMHQGSATV